MWLPQLDWRKHCWNHSCFSELAAKTTYSKLSSCVFMRGWYLMLFLHFPRSLPKILCLCPHPFLFLFPAILALDFTFALALPISGKSPIGVTIISHTKHFSGLPCFLFTVRIPDLELNHVWWWASIILK